MLSTTSKRILLILHIALNAVWMGGIAAILFLVPTRGDADTGLDRALFLINDLAVMNIGFGVILTGLLFSLFTKWGFFDFPWVILKWLGLIVIFVEITFYLAPAVNGMAALSDLHGPAALQHDEYNLYRGQTIRTATFLLVLQVVLVALSVFKPWGPRKKPFKTNRKLVLALGILFGVLALGGGFAQYMMLESFRSVEIADVNVTKVPDGVYVGEAELGVPYRVEVTVQEGRITRIRSLTPNPNHYAQLAEGIFARIISRQTPNVQAVTGATTSSKGVMRAVRKALVD